MKYVRPTTIGEAASAIAAGGLPLAGGTVVVPILALSGGVGDTVVDLGHIAELREIADDGVHLRCGAMVSLARIGASPELRKKYTGLAQAAAAVGNPQVRRAATIGGNVALGVATADIV